MWWQYIIIVLGLAFLVYAMVTLSGFYTGIFTRKTSRRAEDLYPNYADTGPRRGGRHDDGAPSGDDQ